MQIAPSILSADFARLGAEVDAVLDAGADIVHFDVMDNHYVPNLTFGPMICSALRDYGVQADIDVHLMVEPVDAMIEAFAKAGASMISFHPDATPHMHRSISLVKDLGCKVGIALNPGTPLHELEEVIQYLDYVLLMTVNPGFGGQQFIPQSTDKIKRLKQMIETRKLSTLIEVDGGINAETIKQTYDAGADIFVAGSAIFNAKDYKHSIDSLRQAVK
ncbi:ribulose-phosphate 3-epimerase [Agaribacter flavus]|uniref:Ribulose-phosphate 3-epimerase n=1 Tax=Agaribacter flavus TaxID=1902781 RepID=A0ABV7FU77_9ALTE